MSWVDARLAINCLIPSLFEAGISRDGWFINGDLVTQFQKIIPLVIHLHPNFDIVIAFDNSMTHHKKPPDGLSTSGLTKMDGEKNLPHMRNTTFVLDGEVVSQTMVRDENSWRTSWRKENSGGTEWSMFAVAASDMIHTSIEKWNMWTKRANRICLGTCIRSWSSGYSHQCCASYCLSNQPDFLQQKEWLSEVVEAAGFEVIFFPKYEGELNFIELTWAYMKRVLCYDCVFNYSAMKGKIEHLLRGNIPLSLTKRNSRFYFRIMDDYKKELKWPVLDYAMRKYKCHRIIAAGVVATI